MRRNSAPRDNSDPIMVHLMEQGCDSWTYVDELAEDVGLTRQQVRCSLIYLRDEYNAIDWLPISDAVRVLPEGIIRYAQKDRNYDPRHLFDGERARVALGLPPAKKMELACLFA